MRLDVFSFFKVIKNNLFIGCCLSVVMQASHAEAQSPVRGQLLTSIYPLYLIAQAVTLGVESPVLLLDAKVDAHHFQLRPSDLRHIQQADFVLWVGRQHEASLAAQLQGSRHAVALLSLPQIKILTRRNTQGQLLQGVIDTHVWLDPNNALAIADLIASVRAQQYPQDRARYIQNAAQFKQTLRSMSTAQPHLTQPYIAYHDAYQYLESVLGLQYIGSLTTEMDVPVSAAQLNWLKQQRTHISHQICLIAPQGNYSTLSQQFEPLRVINLNENMYGATTFVQAWQQVVGAVQGCEANMMGIKK